MEGPTTIADALGDAPPPDMRLYADHLATRLDAATQAQQFGFNNDWVGVYPLGRRGDDSYRDDESDEDGGRLPAMAADEAPDVLIKRLSSDVLEGRRMFFSSSLPTMASAGAGVSCATCHFEGRNDGLTWTFDSGFRQTPSLAGPVSKTAPITWTNNVGSVSHEVFLTSQGRMGGQGIVDQRSFGCIGPFAEGHEARASRGDAGTPHRSASCAATLSRER